MAGKTDVVRVAPARRARAAKEREDAVGRKRRTDEPPIPGRYQVSSGEVELLRDADRPGGWVLMMNGVPQSYVDLDDPTYLDFEYVRLMADVIDTLAEGPLDAVHVGGGACTLPRYVAATRPGSRQIVIEPDQALVELVRERLRAAVGAPAQGPGHRRAHRRGGAP